MLEAIAKNIRILADFCGKRDIAELTADELLKTYKIAQADIMVLFGGSIICGGDVLTQAMQNRIAKKYIIVGGTGHTTDTLRLKMNEAFPELNTAALCEAEIFSSYIQYRYGLTADFLECTSTNCGNNITYLLDLIAHNKLDFKSIIISQDTAMQRRVEAG